jgi:hypothetical protein
MGGWFAARGFFRSEGLDGLSVTRFCEVLRAEGVSADPCFISALHSHPLFQIADIHHEGKPTRIAGAGRDVRKLDKGLKLASLRNYRELLEDDPGNPPDLGLWHFSHIKK